MYSKNQGLIQECFKWVVTFGARDEHPFKSARTLARSHWNDYQN